MHGTLPYFREPQKILCSPNNRKKCSMSESLHRAASSSAVSVNHRDTPAKQLSTDPKYVFRLKRKLSQLFCDKAGNGVISLDPEFIHADRCINDDNYKVDLWGLKTFLHSCGNATRSLSEKDLEVLFDIIRRDGLPNMGPDGLDVGDSVSAGDSSSLHGRDEEASASYVVDLAEVMLWLRKLFHCTSQQFHAILKRLRAKQLDERLCTFAKRHRKYAARRSAGSTSSPGHPVTRSEVFAYLVSAGGLTQSEAFLFLEYCSVAQPLVVEALDLQPQSPALDVDFVIAALFEFPLPDDIAYPLLMAKFVEAVSDPYRIVSGTSAEASPTLSRSGVTGLYEALVQCDLRDPPLVRLASASQTASDVSSADERAAGLAEGDRDGDSGSSAQPWYYVPNMNQLLDESQFRKLNFLVCGGLPNKECDLLFSFLNDRETGLLPVSVLMEQYAMRLEPVPLHELELWALNVRGALLEKMPNGLNGLHLRLSRFGDRRMPVVELSAALRECGVAQSVAPDAVLDELWRQAPTCGSFVLLLRGGLAPSRTLIIRKLFAMLDADNDGLVSRDVVFSSFLPPGQQSTSDGIFGRTKDWKDDLAAYLKSLPPDDNLSYAEFEYYWGNVAVSVADDNTFTMLLWKAYSMHKPPQRQTSTNSPMRRPATPTQGGAASSSWGSSYCLPQDASPQPHIHHVSRRLLR